MNILYIAFIDFSMMHFGPAKKVLSACCAMEKAGNTVTLVGRKGTSTVKIDTSGTVTELGSHNSYPIGKFQTLIDKSAQMKDIQYYIKDKSFDFCYIRFDLCTKGFLKLLKNIRKVCPKTFIEIPTFPYIPEYSGKINALRLKMDAHYAKQLYLYVDKIITFYDIPNNMFYGIESMTVPNGFDFDNIEVIRNDELPQQIDIAAVSAMRIWHGYERMIEGMHHYYQNGGDRQLILHMVGEGRELPKYKELVEKYQLGDHIIFHGPMHGTELDTLLEACTLGVDSLGRHRTGISLLSSLKSREYGAKGLPFINSCKIDIIDSDFSYMLEVPADESPVDIDSVIQFYDRIYNEHSRSEVARCIREYIESRSDMYAVMKKIIDVVDQD